jgi:hypothetical protein
MLPRQGIFGGFATRIHFPRADVIYNMKILNYFWFFSYLGFFSHAGIKVKVNIMYI